MLQPSTNNFVYFQSDEKKEGQKEKRDLSEDELQKIFDTLSKQAVKEKRPEFDQLEQTLQNSLKLEEEGSEDKSDTEPSEDKSGTNITKLLKEKGYLRDEKKWITKKGFFEIGKHILNSVMDDLKSAEIGLHETKHTGYGNVIMDTTKKFEQGSDMKNLSVQQSLLNSILRISKTDEKIDFPISINLEDFEEFETIEDVKVAIVYCIDLSSTMKYSLGKNGKSRIEAAKKALWSLYLLNKKFFPNDSISVVGFASMASVVKPFDIPYLKTYDANENFLHYTNYQAAFRLARKILKKSPAQNKRIVMITDGQPSACFVDNEHQKNEIISEKPYSNFYSPDPSLLNKLKEERSMNLDLNRESMVYLCYRFKKVDPKIHDRTLVEAKKCKRDGIEIDTLVISEEPELLKYAQDLEQELKGKTYHIDQENMDKVLLIDYLTNTRKILSASPKW